jgi:hypothetical protein
MTVAASNIYPNKEAMEKSYLPLNASIGDAPPRRVDGGPDPM